MKDVVSRSADNIRALSAAMVEQAQSGHPGGAMGGADFINILYAEFLRFDPGNGNWRLRDRFFLDPGHMSPMLYGILHLAGYFGTEDLKQFRQWGSLTPGHPELDPARGVENTSGPLGMGHTFAVGAAIAERFLVARFGDTVSHKTYAFLSDGSIQEEISQGAGRLAGHLGLGNLIMFFDSNDIQLSTQTHAVTSEDTAMKYRSWGWHVTTIDGNDPVQIRQALAGALQEIDRPSLIIGKTIMGKGALDEHGRSFERQTSTHGMPLSKAGASFVKTMRNLGADPAEPFRVFEDVAAYWEETLARKQKEARAIEQSHQRWVEQHPDLALKLQAFHEKKWPGIDFTAIQQKSNIATRAASGVVLSQLAQQLENMIVASADLSNSDKTDGFLKNTTALKKGDFSGAFLQVGVSELTMGAVANGMALHGGVIPVCGTFLVFSDYMKPAVRLAALMELQVIYVWSHDAFRVGEDGPTHQPVEQEAQIRLLEQLKNHSGQRSMLVLRPADAAETNLSWEMALQNTSTPTALLLSRQNIKCLPPVHDDRYREATGARKGGYVVSKDEGQAQLILVGNGSEVSTLYEGAQLIRQRKGLRVQVVSVISEALFREQDAAYQAEVLPPGLPTLGLTAGLPISISGLVGPSGRVVGMDRFGYSAPAGVLDEKLGFTPENVYAQAMALLG